MTAKSRAIVTILLMALTRDRAAASDPPPAPDAAVLWRADRLIERAIEEGQIPGAVLLAGRGDEVVHRKAYGSRSLKPQRVAMTEDTIFDGASLSKPVGCATSIMLLVERGKLGLQDPVAKYIPAFGVNGKESITVEQLLLHRGGLIPDNPMSDYEKGPEASLANVYNLTPESKPGKRFKYTDVGYI